MVIPGATEPVHHQTAPPTGSALAPPGEGGGGVNYQFEFSGVFTWGEVITALCRDGWCRTQLPRDFYELTVPLNIFENTFDDAFKALSMQSKADGYILKKTGRKKPFTVSVRLDSVSTASYISCIDTTVKNVASVDLYRHKLADSIKCASRDSLTKFFIQDSLSRIVVNSRYRVSFYVVSSSFVRSLGVNWTDIWAMGDLVSRPDFITDWTLRAVATNSDLAEYRSIELDIDSAAHLHWGSQVKEQTETFVSGDIVQSNFEWRDYGLTLDLTRSNSAGIRGQYQLLQRDDLNSILEGNFGGGGKDTVTAYGVFDSWEETTTGIPFLKNIPILGYLFETETVDKVTSFFVIEILKVSSDSLKTFETLDSLKIEDINRYEGYRKDSTNIQSDSLNYKENEVVK